MTLTQDQKEAQIKALTDLFNHIGDLTANEAIGLGRVTKGLLYNALDQIYRARYTVSITKVIDG